MAGGLPHPGAGWYDPFPDIQKIFLPPNFGRSFMLRQPLSERRGLKESRQVEVNRAGLAGGFTCREGGACMSSSEIEPKIKP